MIDYIPLFKEALDKKHIRYYHDETLLVFMRRYRIDREADLRMRFIFLLFAARMEVIVSIRHALYAEQIALSRPLFEEVNKHLKLGEVDADNPSNFICFSHTFDPLAGEEWWAEAREQMLDFIIDYTTEIVPPVLLGLFARAAVQAVATH